MAKKSATRRLKNTVSKKRTSSPKKKQSAATGLKFLKSTHSAVRSHMAAASDLPTFLESAGTLSLNGRKRLVEQALVLVDDNFVHLPLKESMHGVDPVQKLRLIQHRLDQTTSATMDSEFQFHRDMIEIFTSVRDLHTNYLLPAPFADKVAFLPFDVEEFFENKEPHYIATHFVQGFSHAHFKQGVEITTWNGVPIRRAIDVSANQHAGSNSAARHARGVDGLTLRALRRALPPDAMWVIIGYIDRNGVARELKQDWIVTPMLPDTGGVDEDSANTNAASLGIDIEADIMQRARKMLFAPKVIAEERKPRKMSTRSAAAGQSVATNMSGVFSARSVTTPSGEFGYIRIFTFSVNDPEAFIDEFIRLAELLPQKGLIVDVRGNGGGHIYASEGLLQVLTPVEITPEPTQFINTPLNGRICDRHKTNPVGIDLGPWVDSILSSVETGAVYSRGFPITPNDFANNKGQKYHGPVVLITDARCYSATDIFAAGFKDHQIGHILGVDANTGAGGANVWTHGLLQDLLRFPTPADTETPYKDLPNGAGMRVAIRRTLRVGEHSGTPVEDLGITPDSPHALTEDDLLNANKDLINEAGRILKKMPVRLLTVSTSQAGSTLTIQATTVGISRLDTYINGRPLESPDINDGTNSFTVDLPAGATLLELAGYKNDEYVAARKLQL
ncbi:MAG: S41 family peptidase [Acidiferrobacterales bacterium]